MMTHNAQGVNASASGIFDAFNREVLNKTGYFPVAGQVSGLCRFGGALAVIVSESVHAATLAIGSVVGPTPKLRGKFRADLPGIAHKVSEASKHLVRGGIELTGAGVVLYYRDLVNENDKQIKELKGNLANVNLAKITLEANIKSAQATINEMKSQSKSSLETANVGLTKRTEELEQLRKDLAAANVEINTLKGSLNKCQPQTVKR